MSLSIASFPKPLATLVLSHADFNQLPALMAARSSSVASLSKSKNISTSAWSSSTAATILTPAPSQASAQRSSAGSPTVPQPMTRIIRGRHPTKQLSTRRPVSTSPTVNIFFVRKCLRASTTRTERRATRHTGIGLGLPSWPLIRRRVWAVGLQSCKMLMRSMEVDIMTFRTASGLPRY